MMQKVMELAEENGKMKAALDYLYNSYMHSIEMGYVFDTEKTVLQIAGYDVPTEAKKKEEKTDE